jgi:hypothetical protein
MIHMVSLWMLVPLSSSSRSGNTPRPLQDDRKGRPYSVMNIFSAASLLLIQARFRKLLYSLQFVLL